MDHSRQPEPSDAAVIADALRASHNADDYLLEGAVPALPRGSDDEPRDPDAPLEELYTQGAVAPESTGATGSDDQ